MAWKSIAETRPLINTLDRDRITRLFGLRTILENVVLPADYVVDEAWEHVVVLSESATAFLETHPRLTEDYSAAVLSLAFFVDLYHHDLWIDVHRTDHDAVKGLVDGEVRSGRLRLPYRFGRLLYDRFNDSPPGDRLEHLDHKEADALLAGTPQGVYQVGYYVTGPLGIVSSAALRYTPPSLFLPLWHCSDTGCRALHYVYLMPPPVAVVNALHAIRTIESAVLGPSSEWRLEALCRAEPVNDLRPFYDLTSALAEAVVEDERRYLLRGLLGSDSGSALRNLIAEKTDRAHANGPPTEVTGRLDDATRLQLLLTLTDRELVRALDRAIVSGGIRIPLYEQRASRLQPPREGDEDLVTDLSVFGARGRHSAPLLQAMSAIWQAYETTNNLEELGWRLRKRAGAPPRSALGEYLQRVAPGEAIRELVLPSMPIALAIGERFGIDIYSEADNTLLVDRILWKLGFNPPRYEGDYQQLRDRIQQFADTLLRVGAVRAEKDRELIRSAGVNLFVSVEGFLEHLVAYNVWILSSDHFLATAFTYSGADALSQVASILDVSIRSGDADCRWNPEGGNTLGTTLAYASAAVDWIRSLAARDSAVVARPAEDLPHFADAQERVFRFRHVQLWGDADVGALRSHAELFANVVRKINQASVATLRNGLDHQRTPEEFPSLEAMLACAARLRDALDLADIHRLVPKTFWLRSRKEDLFGRVEFVLEDYQGRTIAVSGPSVAVSLVALRFSEPYLIAPGGLLSDVGAELRFRVKEASPFSRYWENYPRRRNIPSPHKEMAPERLSEG